MLFAKKFVAGETKLTLENVKPTSVGLFFAAAFFIKDQDAKVRVHSHSRSKPIFDIDCVNIPIPTVN